jgi:gamma-glutamyl:cysteine ligase YbdK (ATP-grasp superfamily)
MHAELIVEDRANDSVSRRPIRELARELVDEMMPIAKELGSDRELRRVLDVIEFGSGSERQRRVVEAGGTLPDVVQHLADELAEDRPLP